MGAISVQTGTFQWLLTQQLSYLYFASTGNIPYATLSPTTVGTSVGVSSGNTYYVVFQGLTRVNWGPATYHPTNQAAFLFPYSGLYIITATVNYQQVLTGFWFAQLITNSSTFYPYNTSLSAGTSFSTSLTFTAYCNANDYVFFRLTVSTGSANLLADSVYYCASCIERIN
jgi:hypothetical protein